MGEITNIEVNNLTFGYGYKKKIFTDFTLSIEPQQITGLVGRNGQGKTTLMKLLAGKFVPDNGGIVITMDSRAMNPVCDIEAANEIIYSADKLYYGEQLKLSRIMAEYEIMYHDFDADFARKLLRLFDIDVNKKIKKISKGQKSLFHFVCAMATRARITILDEPVSGVDAISRNKVYDIILRDYIEHPRTIIISSHMLGEMEKILSRIVMIGNEKVLFSGEIEEMKNKAFRISGATESVEKFVKDQKVLFQQNKTLGATAVVEEVFDEKRKQRADELGLTVTSLTAEEYYIYVTGNHNGEELEQLWEKQN